jgi:hypothetical protein
VEDVAEERGFARAAGAGDHDQAAEREAEVEVLEVAELDAGEFQPVGGGGRFL